MDGPASTRDPVNWSIIFDIIASEYGYTWVQFSGMTYKLLNECLESINRRTHNSIAVQAALRGIQMDLYQKHVPADAKTIEQSRMEAEKILKKRQKEILKKNGC